MNTDLSEPLSEQEITELDEFLLSIDNDDAIYCLSMLDGFLTAIVSGPDIILPSHWLEVVFADGDSGSRWQSEEELEYFLQLMIRFMNNISDLLMDAADEYEPCFLERIDGDNSFLIVDEWCIGYMKGVSLCEDAWQDLPAQQRKMLDAIELFSDEAGWNKLAKMSDREVDQCQAKIPDAARQLHAYWLSLREDTFADYCDYTTPLPAAAANDEPYVRDTPKVGRNDPCPCGSGKKYKKCCG